MSDESVKDYYNRVYALHREHQTPCPNALHDLEKARRRVAGVIRGFGVRVARGANVLVTTQRHCL